MRAHFVKQASECQGEGRRCQTGFQVSRPPSVKVRGYFVKKASRIFSCNDDDLLGLNTQ